MKCAILGGGISGLSAAWYLLKKEPHAEIALFEASQRLGGYVESKELDGFLFELGPRTFQAARCEELLKMSRELGLEVIYSDRAASRRYLWTKGKLRSLKSFWPQLLKAALRDLWAPRGNGEEESIYQFAERRMGQQAAELFFDPIAKGVFGGDIRKLSLQACFPFLHEAEMKEGSLIRHLFKSKKKKEAGLFTFRRGMQSLIDALKSLPIDLHLNSPVEEIRMDGVVAKGRFWRADLIVSALPGLEISRLVNVPLELKNETMSVVNFGYRGDLLPIKGYGYLAPSFEKEKILGQIWDSSIFPIAGQTKITSMTRGINPLKIAQDALERHLGILQPPDAICLKEAHIPQYDVGHIRRIEAFESAIGALFQGKVKLVGNYLLNPSVEGCLRRAQIISTN